MASQGPTIEIVSAGKGTGELAVKLSGNWRREDARADVKGILERLAGNRDATAVRLDAGELGHWDSTLITFLVRLKKLCAEKKLSLDTDALPEGAVRLVELATSVAKRSGPAHGSGRSSGVFEAVGETLLRWSGELREMIDFTGALAVSFARLSCGRAQMQWRDVAATIEDAGPRALPIVTLIAALMGIILAFVGAVQLRMFGAEIFVADLVAIGIVRELGAIMTGIVMAGRTGASYAARIGAMQVNDEIDAFRTMGISPVDFLVLPRILGLVLMMPLLCLYANLVGVLGGMLIGVTLLDLSPVLYVQQTRAALGFNHLAVGLVMSVIFGVLVAYFGCLRGLHCGRSASSVGEATTSSVVSGIVSIVIATAIVTVVADLFGI